MSIYIITGVSSGIGYSFLKSISEDPQNLVVGLVHLTKYATIKEAAAELTKIVGDRGIDYLVGNAGEEPTELDEIADLLFKTNVIGNIYFFNLFIPLVLISKTKKVIAITSGYTDLDFINNFDIKNSALYTASKAALNIIVAKFSAQYKKDGVLVFSISPGVVEVAYFVSQKQTEGLIKFVGRAQAYTPYFKSPVPVEGAVQTIRGMWERASIETGYTGAFMSHFGNKQ